MRKFLQCALPLLMLVLLAVFTSAAWAQETTGGMQGYIKDPSGAVIPKASVTLTSPALLEPRTVQTDSAGYYRFAQLPPGVYDLAVKASNFREYKQTGIEVAVGRLPQIDVKMQVGSTSETVEVSGAAPIVDPTTSKAAVTITQQQINDVPKTREFYSLITFAPGARQEPLQSNGRGNSGFQIDGASDSENAYLVEGMNTTNIQDGGLGRIDNTLNTDFVQEVQIKSSGYEAEYGGATGGVVNVIEKRGGNQWHGSVFTYYRGDQITASDHAYLRLDPNSVPNYTTDPTKGPIRSGQAAQYYQPKQDRWRTIEPGFTVGGYIVKNRLWVFTGFDPTLNMTRRTVNFAGSGNHTFVNNNNTYNWQTRLDANLTNKLHLWASWNYAYNRNVGQLPGQDSPYGQFNNDSKTDPSNFLAQAGSVNPDNMWSFGGDWQLSNNVIVTGRYGYWFYNTRSVGLTTGNRYIYESTAQGLPGYPAAFALPAGFSNIGSNFQTLHDAYFRHTMSYDVSIYKSGFLGTHNFKFGYENNKLGNNLLTGYNTSLVLLYPGQNYQPNGPTGVANCAAVIAANGACTGKYGYYEVYDYSNFGEVHSYNHSIYGQDAWTVGHGLTLNLGVRFDKEYLPPYTQGAPSISFGFTQKVAPRIGGAWDIKGNGKWKLYASYGKFFDIMKYSLPRGSFGGDFWHTCDFTLDNPDYTTIQPARTQANDHYCFNGAGGTEPGTFLEEFNWRSVILDPKNPGVDPNIHPMQQHEFVVGLDHEITPTLGLETRYVRKRLDYTIEDNGVDVPGNELYFIGNPGYGIVSNLLQKSVGDSSSLPTVYYPPICPSCPLEPRAQRRYDGLEVRVIKRYGNHWFGQAVYTYSHLYGNYPGLTSTFLSDAGSTSTLSGAGGGRHSPNNNRSFDLPHMQFTAHGKPFDGPLPTDRPHTLSLYGSYHLRWFGSQESTLGISQVIYSGTPISTTWPAVSTASAVQFVENQGNFVKIHRDPTTGNLVSDGIIYGDRTPIFTQTNAQFTHSFHVSKTNEAMMVQFTFNVLNLLNQHAVMARSENPIGQPGHHTEPYIGGVGANGIDELALTKTGWDYMASANGGLGNPVQTFNNLYNLPSLFQQSRSAYFGFKFVF